MTPKSKDKESDNEKDDDKNCTYPTGSIMTNRFTYAYYMLSITVGGVGDTIITKIMVANNDECLISFYDRKAGL
uniref:Uncharacterized protein n=1 Tax=Romanomermis culicivorax TaxID=13658 RepID=A0A915K2N6_ROMCU